MNTKLAIAVLLLLGTGVVVIGLLDRGRPEADDAGGVAAGERGTAEPATVAAESLDVTGNGAGRTRDLSLAGGESGSGTRISLLEAGGARAREVELQTRFAAMAAWGVEAALAQVRQLPDAEARDMAMLALLGEWSGMTMTELVRRGEVGRFGVAGALALNLLEQDKLSPQQAAALADEFLDGSERGRVLARVGETLAATDPAAALALGEDLSGWQQTRFLERVAAGWAKTSPQQAQAWAAQIEDPGLRSSVMRRILGEMAQADPAAAAQAFAQAPPEDASSRERLARQIGSSWGDRDTLAAMQWAASLPDESARLAAQRGINAVAPIGIGARLAQSPDGLPVLQDLVPGGPASLSGQLRAGDRLLAVSDGRGGWVDTRTMTVGDVVGLIRGEPNTQVIMQVQAPGEAAARVVTLGRQQVVHRPQ
jgi:hypothetical protein